MEFIERIPIDRMQYLTEMSFDEYMKHAKQSSSKPKSKDEHEKSFKMMKEDCHARIKANGEIKRLYKFTGSHTWSETGEGTGRLFSFGRGVQGLPRFIRGFLLKGYTTDVDMKNAHPRILLYLCKLHNIPCENLELYVNKRDDILAQFPDRETGKTLFLKATNDDKRNFKEKNEIFKAYDIEMKKVQKVLTSLTCYKLQTADVPEFKIYNWYGSAINRILCYYENRILQVMVNTTNRRGIEIMAPMFDGKVVYGDYYEDGELSRELEAAIEAKFPGMDMELAYKEHETTIMMPEEWKPSEKIDVEKLRTFEKVASEFEKTHCKIADKAVFVKQTEDENLLMSKMAFRTANEHMTYDKLVKDKVVKANFIDDWMRNNDKIRAYDDVGIYPVESKCPKNIFNLWRPFAMEKVTDWTPNSDAVEKVRDHMRTLCNHDEGVFQFFEKWIAHMIQYPDKKEGTMMILISKQGAGKGSLIRMLSKILGHKKLFETGTPARDVFGDFNAKMSDAFLVVLDEVGKKDMFEDGPIKRLITEPTLDINAKGVNQVTVSSYHRFIATTNNEDPVKTKTDDRRNVIVRASDKLIGNTEYFSKLHETFDNVDNLRTIYEHFKTLRDVPENFTDVPTPETEYHRNIKESNRHPFELWLMDFVRKNYKETTIEMSSKEVYSLFTNYITANGFKFETNSVKLGMHISNMVCPGLGRRRTSGCMNRLFDIPQLYKHFKLGEECEL